MSRIENKVLFKISGINISKFISKCALEGVRLENVRYCSNKDTPQIELTVKVRYAKKIIKLAHSYKLKVIIAKRTGAGFFIQKNKSRYVLMIGAIAACIVLYIMSCFVWKIELVGNNQISDARMYELLDEVGIRTFVAIDKTRFNSVVNEIKLKESKIANLSINTSGVKITVNVTEKMKYSPINQTGEFRNLYSKTEGIVEDILVYCGRAMVKKGDIIKKGDILISGDLSTEDKSILVYASGKVTAHAAYSFSATAGPEIDGKTKSGNSEDINIISIFGKELFECNYTEYDIEYTKNCYTCNNIIPIKFRHAIAHELIDGKIKPTEKELYKIAETNALKKLNAVVDKNAVILSKSTVKNKNDNGSITVIINIVVEEDAVLY